MDFKNYNYIKYFKIFIECRSEEKVDQPDTHVSEAERKSVTLDCTSVRTTIIKLIDT